ARSKTSKRLQKNGACSGPAARISFARGHSGGLNRRVVSFPASRASERRREDGSSVAARRVKSPPGGVARTRGVGEDPALSPRAERPPENHPEREEDSEAWYRE